MALRDGNMEIDEDESTRVQNYTGYFSFKGHDTVTVAKPSKEMISNLGEIGSIPRSNGLVFPYFHGLIQPDTNFMNNIILRCFYQLLGSTYESCQATYLDIRHGINSLASTARGMKWYHLLLGIDLALETQSRCFVLRTRNQY